MDSTPSQARSWSHRFVLSPLAPAILLGYFAYRIASSGSSVLLVFGLVAVGAWLLVSVWDLLRGPRTAG